MSMTVWIILWGALVTYAARAGGYIVLARFKTLNPRLEAALNAVPAAVLTTIVAPAPLTGGPAELASLGVAGLAALRGGLMSAFLCGAAALLLLRAIIGA